MKQGSIVEVNYTGKTVLDGKVFESTVEKKAIEAGIFSEKAVYKPEVVVVGEGHMLKGLDRALDEMKEGEQRKVVVKPEEGWGQRKPESVRVVPLQQFKEKKIMPFPGLVVEANGMQGRVQSVSGGRVRVDFNHPLAGKELEYELKVERELKQPKEQIEALYGKYFYMVPEAEKTLSIGKGDVEISLSPRWSANLGPLKTAFSGIVTKHVKGFEKVRFVEEFKQDKEAQKAPEKQEKALEGQGQKTEEKQSQAGKTPAGKQGQEKAKMPGKQPKKARKRKAE
jgi:FKBP-type peptidyl-prolyl cis-trans isomerase 2